MAKAGYTGIEMVQVINWKKVSNIEMLKNLDESTKMENHFNIHLLIIS